MPFRPDTKYMTASNDKAQVLLVDAPGSFPIVGFVIIAGVRDFARWSVDGVHQTDVTKNLVPWTINVSQAMLDLAAGAGTPTVRIRLTIRQWIAENYATLKDVF
jgi:hypothetical protein